MSALFRARTADFDRLYRRHAASVYRYAYAVLGNHADAEDATQQTFMNAYRAIAQGTRPRKAENWLLTIAHNEVRRHFRSAQTKVLEVELDEELPQAAHERSEPSLADVLRALQHLPPIQRSALVMREFEGRSYAEIAQIMNVTQSALEAQVFRARRALAEHLEGGLTCVEAEQAISRRLDGRLPRRVARGLKAHLRECPVCVRFAEAQKRQRALLRGLSVMPIPASIFLFRGEQAAATAGLGAGAAAGGSAVVGGGSAAVGTGATGIAAGVAAKAAAVTAAAAVAGGVGYGVTAGPQNVTKATSPVAEAAAVSEPRTARRTARVRSVRPHKAVATTIAHSQRKTTKVKTRAAKPVPAARKAAKAPLVAVIERAKKNPVLHIKARRTTTRSPERSAAPKLRPQPARGKAHAKAAHVTASPAPRGRAKPEPSRGGALPSRDVAPPPEANPAERGQKNQ
jgi:RNA polymerase sigma-70 factor, ECF subfamily